MLNKIPLIASLLVTCLLTGYIELGVYNQTGQVFMYPLDDPFIHMELAKNISQYGMWGINPTEFASASSSILYSLLLAILFKITGAQVVIPFLVNCVAAIFLLIAVCKWLQKNNVSSLASTLIILAVVMLLPLPILIVSGMEHTLQCLFSFLFITKFVEWLQYDNPLQKDSKRKLLLELLVYGFLCTAIRYEGMFLIVIAGMILLFNRNFKQALMVGTVGLLPVFLFAAYSIMHGSYFFPNPLYIKSDGLQPSLHGLVDFVGNILVNKLTIPKQQNNIAGVPPAGISLLATQRLLIILPLIYLLSKKQFPLSNKFRSIALFIILTIVFHLAFASTGWFYRYEAYLIFNAIILIGIFVYKNINMSWQKPKDIFATITITVLLFMLSFPFVLRSLAGFTKAKQACINIFEQQYQMAKFVHKNYNDSAVAANDIGALAYFTNSKIVDLWGLGDFEITKSRKHKYWTPNFLNSLVISKQVKLAIVYDEWFDQLLLNNWTKVATWTIHNNVITGGETVSFYAINKADVEDLRTKLVTYEKQLPATITVQYK